MKPDDYVPERFDADHIKVLVRLRPCATCRCPTVANLDKNSRTFPLFYRTTFEAQIKRADVRLVGNYDGDGEPICVVCAAAGAIMCKCELCGITKKSNEMKESIGASPDHLCIACYETVPAKTWDEKLASLEDAHKYDYC